MIVTGSRRTGGETSVKYTGINMHRIYRVCVKNRGGIILNEFNLPNGRSGFILPLDTIGDEEAKALTESKSNLAHSTPSSRRRVPKECSRTPRQGTAEGRLKNA